MVLPDNDRHCTQCSKPAQQHENYCSWECQIEHAKQSGYVVHLPNDLRAGCITGDGKILECEHGDHPDYKHPVEVKWTGELDPVYRHLLGEDASDEDIRSAMSEVHALIYADSYIAVTLHETWYYTWRLSTGRHMYNVRQDYLLSSLEIPEYMRKKS